MSEHPVFIPKLVNEAIRLKEKNLGRPLTSTEILQTFGEVIEPDASKRLHLGHHSHPPTKIWTPPWAKEHQQS